MPRRQDDEPELWEKGYWGYREGEEGGNEWDDAGNTSDWGDIGGGGG